MPSCKIQVLPQPSNAGYQICPIGFESGRTSAVPDPALRILGPSEREAIQLAQEQHADLLLIDERRGRAEALRRGLATTGTLGVLLAAAERGLVDAVSAYNRLMRETNFRATPALQTSFLQQIRGSER
ncbi:MAG TPA: DUF3368 domain-containing protein [Terriglobales bacterium]|nr:DUF3368 domain-containing protein [Terriglobales bacterium]